MKSFQCKIQAFNKNKENGSLLVPRTSRQLCKWTECSALQNSFRCYYCIISIFVVLFIYLFLTNTTYLCFFSPQIIYTVSSPTHLVRTRIPLTLTEWRPWAVPSRKPKIFCAYEKFRGFKFLVVVFSIHNDWVTYFNERCFLIIWTCSLNAFELLFLTLGSLYFSGFVCSLLFKEKLDWLQFRHILSYLTLAAVADWIGALSPVFKPLFFSQLLFWHSVPARSKHIHASESMSDCLIVSLSFLSVTQA